jgi:hypothetical protein
MSIPRARKCLELRLALNPLVAAGQDLEPDARRRGKRREVRMVLPREDLGGRHHHPLPARLDGDEKRHQRHQRLARPHVALQEPVHPLRGGHVGGDLRDGPLLRAGRAIGQRGAHLGREPPARMARHARRPPPRRAGERQRQLMREKLVIGEPPPRGGIGQQVQRPLRRMGSPHRRVPGRPAFAPAQFGVDPFGQVRRPVDRPRRRLRHLPLGEAARQGINGFESGDRAFILGAQDMVGVDHLRHPVEDLDRARHHAALPGGKLLRQPVGARVEEDE